MGSVGIKSTKMLLVKPFSVPGLRCMSRTARPNDHGRTTSKDQEAPPPSDKWRPGTTCWVPHPRTGIYFPIGQEWVMESIPSDAASFDCTFWLRSIDGVDDHKPDNENITDNYPNYKP